LSISKRLVEMMGGALSIESTVGVGTCFRLTLPIEVAHDATPPAAARAPLDRRVLVIEGSASWRRVIAEQLSAWQMDCTTEASGLRALERMREVAGSERPFEVIVVASRIDDIGADELLRRMANDPALAAPSIVHLGYLGEQPLAEDVATKVSAQLHKPMRISQLYDSVAGVFNMRESQRARRTPRHAAPSQSPLLLVEDNEINALVATEQLRELGYEVDLARNGREAIEAVRKRRYAAVLMDCQMPVMDGYQASRELRRSEVEGEHLPIIALTAHALGGERDKVAAAGMDDYLTKPVRPESLRKALERHLVHAAPSPPVDASPPPRARATSEPELDPVTPRSAEVVALFLRLVPDQLDVLSRAIETRDAAGARAQAHKVKGSGLSVGARRFARTAGELQRIVEAGRLTLAAEKLEELRAGFERLRVSFGARSRGDSDP
jgi:CheY-like chemotaxis protein/HPt (histidine-containing phosphotransfer) domain-containing protein